MTENQLLDAIRRLCARHHVWHYHAASVPVAPRFAGFPDLVLLGTHAGAFREIKTATGRTTPAQWAVGARMRAAGLDWAIWRPADLASGRVEEEIAALSGRVPWGEHRCAA